ncbi:MAG: hypothetical protein GY947_08825, partial [Rhodobacteraceae bacterium]|nr:hypothetical protein [Paracoccaceae bacterium]
PDAPELAFNSEIAATVNEIGDAAGDVSTAASMSAGDSFQGALQVVGDTDWVKIDLTAGIKYDIDLFQPGSEPFFDTYLRIYDENGVLLFSDDDSGVGLSSSLRMRASYSGTYYIEADSVNNQKIGNYQIDVEARVPPAPPSPTDALVWDGADWDNSQTINVFFALGGTTVDDEGTTIASDGFTFAEINLILGIFSGVTEFANINFQQTTNQGAADIELATDDLGASLLGYMYPQGSSSSSDGLGVFNSNSTFWNPASMAVGGFMYSVIIHELGHGLGLAHPHDNGGGSDILPGVTSSSDTGDNGEMNQSIYTIMSYNDSWNGHPLGLPATYAEGYMSSFAALDMAVLQSYYGANMSHNTGANTYSMGSNAYYMTIWDAGGKDKIVVTDGTDSVIDLRAATLEYAIGGGGYISYTSGTMGGFTIANGVVIENAVGDTGRDTLIGNEVRNVLKGKGDRDTISGLDGDDKIVGGGGNDKMYGDAGSDEMLGGGGKDILNGGSSADTLTGNKGDDKLNAGAGDDTLFGGDGADLIIGGNGDDTLDGGGDADTFKFDLDDGTDDIVRFKEADFIDVSGLGLGYGDLTINITGSTATVSFGSTVLNILDLQADLGVSDFILV